MKFKRARRAARPLSKGARALMDQTTEEAIRDILAELNIALEPIEEDLDLPVEETDVNRAMAHHGLKDVVLTVRSMSGLATVGLIEKSWLSGCPRCLQSRQHGIEHFYDGLASTAFDLQFAQDLVKAMHSRYGVAIAVTEAYDPQNWSVIAPVPFCSVCSDIEREFDDARVWNAPSMSSAAEQQIITTAGFRVIPPEVFVSRNRATVGFAALIGNPVVVEQSRACSLVNGPIIMADDPAEHEVAGGKGWLVEQSLASCVGEGLERYFTARPFRRRGMVAARDELGPTVVDLLSDFGFPARDNTPGIEQYRDDLPIEWFLADDLVNEQATWFPANLMFCPYLPPTGASVISAGSTNGAACGATRQDATLQALLELIERDAFWYYSRTGANPQAVPWSLVPADIISAMRSYGGSFRVQLLQSPFDLPVVQVTYDSDGGEAASTARGTGATDSLGSSVRRAFTECIQMLESLSSGQAVEECATDMRRLWYTGQSRSVFPNFFRETTVMTEEAPWHFPDAQSLFKHIVAAAVRQELGVYRIVIAETQNFAVVRAAMSSISVMDGTYFMNNDRIARFAEIVDQAPSTVNYSGSLFM
ncbi:YcaO-like family protein [Curtobacterium sp. MCLR17_007]|uniref:YcaO-like family protein n=1 Tax=Curtobacterium sp. MCLR17_007 TaxID=2175648 RepID=UPI000DAA163F|nr:YcaO-like family protein [Curtobacterium sp. MCLR17_007]WIB61102.1 YcaO-like family protein [Curtobacterium sp. MCLR17_007]